MAASEGVAERARDAREDDRVVLVLGTRGSTLALWQAEHCRGLLVRAYPDIAVRIEVIQSLGDQLKDQPLRSLDAQGIFTAALETALMEGRINVAVHSAKDLPSTLPDGFAIAATPTCAERHDCLVSRDGSSLEHLQAGATVGTGSPRRMAQLRAVRPDLRFVAIRGNVDTRRRAALAGRVDAVVLAAAGLARLGLLDAHAAALPIEVCLPQAGQGMLALETQVGDRETRRLLEAVDDPELAALLAAERAVLEGLAAGCQAPVAAYAVALERKQIRLRAVVSGAKPESALRTERDGAAREARELGLAVAHELRGRGAAELLRQGRETPW